MAAHVFTDARLMKQAGRFVWLSVDAEKEQNGPFLEKYPIRSYPTYFVIDPEAERPVLRWPGAATVKQFQRLLDDGLVALGAAGGSGPEEALARADRAYAEGKTDEAVAAYREALTRGGAGWERRGRALESLVGVLAAADQNEACATAALADGPGMPRGSSRAAVLSNGLGCAIDAEGEPAWRKPAIEKLEPLTVEAAKDPELLDDVRAWILQALGEAREAAGDAKGAQAAARKLWSFLEVVARRTPNAELRASLDNFRTSAAISLKQPELAVPALRASEKALPEDYNPSYRLGLLYREMKRYDDAQAAADRALAKAYGPRKLRIYDLKASVLEGKKDQAGRKAVLQEALAYADTLPEHQRKGGIKRLLEQMREKLAATAQ